MSTRSSLANRLIATGLLICLLIALGSGWAQAYAGAHTNAGNIRMTGDAHRVSLTARQTQRVRTSSSLKKSVDWFLAPTASTNALTGGGSVTQATVLFSQLLSDSSTSARAPPSRC